MMNSRERVKLAFEHNEPDRVPVDLGATGVTGMHVSTVYLLRQALGLDTPGTPVKILHPAQMLGEIKPDLMDALGIDCVMLAGTGTSFGYKLEGWKKWRTFDGTPVLVPAGFNTAIEPDGSLLQYPQGDRSAEPSARMPAGGFYFDIITRQTPINDARLRPEDNLEEFEAVSNDEVEHFRREAERLYRQTDKAIVLNLGGAGLGDIARVPGPGLRRPKGIRDPEEWYVSLRSRRDYVYAVFEHQTEIALANIDRIREAVGERVAVVYWTGTDFGTQNGPLISPKTYRELFFPFHKKINDWIHRHTSWKTFIHSCGSVSTLLEDFIAAGFDILNPVQCSAANMEPAELKKKFGGRITFWGGGVDTQNTLPFGTPGDVRSQVRERVRVFGPGGGFVFNAIHNVQALVPVENVLAMYRTAADCGRYPLRFAH
jgi:hypothetical protein